MALAAVRPVLWAKNSLTLTIVEDDPEVRWLLSDYLRRHMARNDGGPAVTSVPLVCFRSLCRNECSSPLPCATGL